MSQPNLPNIPRWVGTNLHERIVNDVWPNGVNLHCPGCDKREHCDVAAAAEYLAHGWPKCCGVTMQIEGAR